jgi:hypothetical protein
MPMKNSRGTRGAQRRGPSDAHSDRERQIDSTTHTLFTKASR